MEIALFFSFLFFLFFPLLFFFFFFILVRIFFLLPLLVVVWYLYKKVFAFVGSHFGQRRHNRKVLTKKNLQQGRKQLQRGRKEAHEREEEEEKGSSNKEKRGRVREQNKTTHKSGKKNRRETRRIEEKRRKLCSLFDWWRHQLKINVPITSSFVIVESCEEEKDRVVFLFSYHTRTHIPMTSLFAMMTSSACFYLNEQLQILWRSQNRNGRLSRRAA